MFFLKDDFWDRLDEAFFNDPNRLFPQADFTLRAKGWTSPYHILTDGHTAKDGNGTVITRRVPYMLFDGSDFSTSEHYATGGGRDWKDVANTYGVYFDNNDSVRNNYVHVNTTSLNETAKAASTNFAKLPDNDPRKAYALSRFTPDEITDYEVGVFTDNEMANLKKLAPNAVLNEKGAPKFANVPNNYIIIPRRSGGKITGFVCRYAADNAPASDRYRHIALWDENEGKTLFGLPTSYARSNEATLIVVEGEISSIKIASKINVTTVGMGGHSLTENQAKAIARAGYSNIVLITDNDGADRADDWRKNVETSVGAAHNAGLTIYTAHIPNETNEKVGADDYVCGLSSIKAKGFVFGAPLAARTLFNIAVEQYTDEANDQEKGDYLRRTARIMTDFCKDEIERASVLKDARKIFGNDVAEAIDKEAEKATDDKRKKYAAKLNKDAAAAFDADDIEKAERLMAGAMKLLHADDDNAKPKPQPLPQNAYDVIKNRKAGEFIDTPYEVNVSDNETMRLCLPTGAITVVGARTGGAKTKFLENVTLSTVDQLKDDEQILFFESEEEPAAILEALTNVKLNDVNLGQSPTRCIADVLERNNYEWLAGVDDAARAQKASSVRKAFGEIAAMTQSGKLTVFAAETVEDVVRDTKRAIKENGKRARLILVDYIQLLNTEAGGDSTKETMTAVCKELIKLSKRTGAAVVVASQLNRTVLDPSMLTINAISDASNIEHAANLVLLQWNSDTGVFPGSRWDEPNTVNEVRDKCNAHEFLPGTAGKLAVTVAKNRSGARGLWGFFGFCGKTGKVFKKTNL